MLSLALLLGMFPNTVVPVMATGNADTPQEINLSTVNGGGGGYTYADSNGSKVITITQTGVYSLTQDGNTPITANVIVEPTTKD